MSNEPPVHPESDTHSEFNRQVEEAVVRAFTPPVNDRAERILQSAIDRAQDMDEGVGLNGGVADARRQQNESSILHDNELTTGKFAEETKTNRRLRSTFLRRLAVAASLFMGVGGVWLIWSNIQNANQITDSYSNLTHRSFSEIYNSAAQNKEDFWVCENRRQFITTFWQQLGHGAELNPNLPDGVVALGLSYADALSKRSIILGGTYNDTQPIVVVIDRVDSETNLGAELPDPQSGLKVHKKESPPLVMYEISRLDHPVLLDNINSVNMPNEWIPGHARFRKPNDQPGETNPKNQNNDSGN